MYKKTMFVITPTLPCIVAMVGGENNRGRVISPCVLKMLEDASDLLVGVFGSMIKEFVAGGSAKSN